MDNVDDDDDDLDDDCGGHVDHPSRNTKARTLALGGGNHGFRDEGHVINAQNDKIPGYLCLFPTTQSTGQQVRKCTLNVSLLLTPISHFTSRATFTYICDNLVFQINFLV